MGETFDLKEEIISIKQKILNINKIGTSPLEKSINIEKSGFDDKGGKGESVVPFNVEKGFKDKKFFWDCKFNINLIKKT